MNAATIRADAPIVICSHSNLSSLNTKVDNTKKMFL